MQNIIKGVNKRFLFLILMATAASAVALTSCGKDDIFTAQNGSRVVVMPDSISNGSLAAMACGSFAYTVTETFRVTVLDVRNNPVNNAAITVQVPYSAGSGGGLTPTVMYVLDGDTGFPVLTYPYNTSTGDSGTKDITIVFDLSCSWGPVDITVFSGTASDTLEVEVT